MKFIRIKTTYNEMRDYHNELISRRLKRHHELNEAMASEGLGHLLSRDQIDADLRVIKRQIQGLSDAMMVVEMLAATGTVLGADDEFIAVFAQGGYRVEFAYIEIGGFRYSTGSFE